MKRKKVPLIFTPFPCRNAVGRYEELLPIWGRRAGGAPSACGRSGHLPVSAPQER